MKREGSRRGFAPIVTIICVLSTAISTQCAVAKPASVSQHPAVVAVRRKVLPLNQMPERAVTIDGDLTEWEPLSRDSGIIQQSVDHLSGPLAPESNDAAAIKLRRDNQALYVAMRVVDASVVNTFDPGRYFFGDCIEMFLDVRPLAPRQGRKLGDTIYSDGVYQLLIVPPTSDGKQLRWKQWNQLEKKIGQIEIAGRLLTDGYAIEIRIPFASFFNAPATRFNQPIGFDIMLDDNDANQQEEIPQQRVYSWGGLGNAFRDPSRFAVAWPDYRNPLTAPLVRTIQGQMRSWDKKLWMRAALITTRSTAPASTAPAKEPIELAYHFASSDFDRMPTAPEGAGSDAAAKLEAAPAGTVAVEVKPDIAAATPVATIDYPQLGVVLHSRSLELRKLPAGRYSFNATFPAFPAANVTARYYGVPQGDEAYLMEVTAEHQRKDLLEALVTSAVYINLENHYPLAGQPVRGRVSMWSHPRVWWEMSERAAGNQQPHNLRLHVSRSAGAKPVHSIEVPIRSAAGASFVIPADKLPVGTYHLTAVAVAPATSPGSHKVRPISWQDNVQGQTVVQTPTVPLVVMAPHQTVLPTTIQDAPRVLTKAVEIGSPNRARFPKDDAADTRARSVWDMHYYQGRIYVGCGEWTDNRGPIDIWSFVRANDGQPTPWLKEFTVDDESVDIFRDYNGKLYVPGIDAREEWDFGNLYIKSGNAWQKKRTIVNGIHVLDAAVFNGKLYASTGTDTGAALFESSNEGQSWVRRGESWAEGRFYEIVPLRDFLLVIPGQAQQGAYKYQNGKLQRLLVPLFPGLGSDAFLLTHRLQRFGDGAVYTINSNWGNQTGNAPLFFLNDFQRGAVTVQQFQADHVSDVVVRDGKCYVLTAKANGDASEGAIYVSSDLKAWTRLATFGVPALPKSLEMMGGVFYVGLANRKPDVADAASGSVWMIQE